MRFRVKIKICEEKSVALTREARYLSLKLTTIQVRKPVIPTKTSDMSILCDHLRMLRGHLRMSESITVKVCTFKARIRLEIGIEIELDFDQSKQKVH